MTGYVALVWGPGGCIRSGYHSYTARDAVHEVVSLCGENVLIKLRNGTYDLLVGAVLRGTLLDLVGPDSRPLGAQGTFFYRTLAERCGFYTPTLYLPDTYPVVPDLVHSERT